MNTRPQQMGWDAFVAMIANLPSPAELKQMMDLFLTKEEQEDIGMRYLIVKALIDGEQTQRDIAKSLEVSIAKITRGSNCLKQIDPQFKSALKEVL